MHGSVCGWSWNGSSFVHFDESVHLAAAIFERWSILGPLHSWREKEHPWHSCVAMMERKGNMIPRLYETELDNSDNT